MRLPAALAASAAAAIAVAASPAEFRFSRPIEAAAGWARLELPDDVLDASRAGLPDLRILDGSGREIAYAVERDAPDAWRSFPALNLESIEKEETVFLIDRGSRPGIADAVTIDVAGADYLKPVRVQASDDRKDWKDVANGSIFATGDVRMTTLSLPSSDRRYLRFRLDDRNGAPLRPAGAAVRWRSPGAGAVGERPVSLDARTAGAPGRSLYAAALPAAHLAVTALRFQAADPAFSRPVRIFERVFFRDEVCRRLLAEATLTRSPGEDAAIDAPVDGIAGRNLEIEIEDGDSPALAGLSVRALVQPTRLLFLAPGGPARLRLFYGSPAARAPVYDLARALAGRNATRFAPASLGPPVESASVPPAIAAPARVPLADPEDWPSRIPILLPAHGTVAYLDFAEIRNPSAIRIVDGRNRQVPFIVEQGAHESVRDVRLEMGGDAAVTRARIDAANDSPPMDAIELRASGPEYFSRSVRIEEEERDERGVTGMRVLGAARWERAPGQPPAALRIPTARPRDRKDRLFVVIENGDNPPVALSGARAFTSSVRVDFLFEPGDTLFLVSGNDEARPPAYDLALLASAVLAAPAEPARLGAPPAVASSGQQNARPAWFWAAVGAAVIVLLLQLGRVLRSGG